MSDMSLDRVSKHKWYWTSTLPSTAIFNSRHMCLSRDSQKLWLIFLRFQQMALGERPLQQLSMVRRDSAIFNLNGLPITDALIGRKQPEEEWCLLKQGPPSRSEVPWRQREALVEPPSPRYDLTRLRSDLIIQSQTLQDFKSFIQSFLFILKFYARLVGSCVYNPITIGSQVAPDWVPSSGSSARLLRSGLLLDMVSVKMETKLRD